MGQVLAARLADNQLREATIWRELNCANTGA